MDFQGRHHADDLRALARQAMVEKGLEPDFEPEVNAQLAGIKGPAAGEGLRDLRELPWCSIDNDDSKDLDQLTVAQPASQGTRVLIAVADVDALVARDTPIDKHAAVNTTSVYTPAQVFPMLPLRLSTDLTSLNEGQDRVALVMDLTVDANGKVTAAEIYRAWVHNAAQLAYHAVGAWLEGTGPIPPKVAAVKDLADQLHQQDQVAQALRTCRHERGALELESLEARPVFDADVLVDLKLDRQDRAKQLIEDLMIAANGAAARYLGTKSFPSFRRVVREPEKWPRLVEVAREHGETLPDTPDPQALAGFLVRMRRQDPVRFPDLSLVVVKLLGRGEYVVQRAGGAPLGHFALAVRDYSHSTAPNRRYPDLITHRLLKAALAGGKPPYSDSELDRIAAHCTEQEDDADRVERQMRKSAAAMLLEGRVGARFDGLVTGAGEKGTWVRIVRPPVEGRLVRGGRKLKVGQRVSVTLLATDFEKGWIDFGAG